jgi:hypothetical protein
MSNKTRMIISICIALVFVVPMTIFVTRSLSEDKSIAADESTVATTTATTAVTTSTTVSEKKYELKTRKLKPITVTTTVTSKPETTTATTTETTPATTTAPKVKPKPAVTMAPQEYRHFDHYVWAGDSRTVGFAACCGIAGKSVLAKEGIGLNWCKENINSLYSLEKCNIIFNFGVNDLGNVYNYVDFYNNLPDEFLKKNQVFIMSINPVDENIEKQKGYSVTNASIDNFNNILRDNLRKDIYFLDVNAYLKNIGISSWDGLHYNASTYQDILNYTIKTITYVKE